MASIIQAARHFLDQQEEIRMEDEDDNHLITELSEVQSYSEIDNGPVHAGVNVKGRLRRHVEFWKRIGAPEYLISYQGWLSFAICSVSSPQRYKK